MGIAVINMRYIAPDRWMLSWETIYLAETAEQGSGKSQTRSVSYSPWSIKSRNFMKIPVM